MQFAWGYVPPLILEAAIRHRVFDVLDSGPKAINDVQKETGASERGLTAIMNALVGLNLLAKDDQGRVFADAGKRRIPGQHEAGFSGRPDSPLQRAVDSEVASPE